MKEIRTFAGDLYHEWKKDEVMRHAAAIAYYTVFSLPALILIVLSIAGSLIGEANVTEEVFGRMRLYIGSSTVSFLQETLQNIQAYRGSGMWAGLAGITVLLVGATGIIRELQFSLNRILNIHKPKKTFMQKVWNYAFSFLLLVVTACVLIASILAGALLTVLGQRVGAYLPVAVDTLAFINSGVSTLCITLLLFLLYLFLPAKRYPTLIVLLSSLIASALMVTGTVIVSYYIGRAGLGRAYGVAASLLILLFWIYFGANVFLLGAELIEVTARLQGIAPVKKKSSLARILRRIR